jgi:hypothetical protein
MDRTGQQYDLGTTRGTLAVTVAAEAESPRGTEASWECLVSKNQVVGSCQDQEQDSLAPQGFNTGPHTLTERTRGAHRNAYDKSSWDGSWIA